MNAQEQTYLVVQEHRIARLVIVSTIVATSATNGVTIGATIGVTIGGGAFGVTSAVIGVTITVDAFGVQSATLGRSRTWSHHWSTSTSILVVNTVIIGVSIGENDRRKVCILKKKKKMSYTVRSFAIRYYEI